MCVCLQRVATEISVLQGLQHPLLPTLHQVYTTGSELCMEMTVSQQQSGTLPHQLAAAAVTCCLQQQQKHGCSPGALHHLSSVYTTGSSAFDGRVPTDTAVCQHRRRLQVGVVRARACPWVVCQWSGRPIVYVLGTLCCLPVSATMLRFCLVPAVCVPVCVSAVQQGHSLACAAGGGRHAAPGAGKQACLACCFYVLTLVFNLACHELFVA